jgi:hypothetical protein
LPPLSSGSVVGVFADDDRPRTGIDSLIGVVDEKALIRFHPLRDAFRVIETIDADDQLAGAKPGHTGIHILSTEGRIELCQCPPRNLSHPALSSSPIAKSELFQILHLIAMLECLLLPERALKEAKTFSDMANELVEIGLFDPKEAEE